MRRDLLERVRTTCREVARRSRSVRIADLAIPGYAAGLPMEQLALPRMDPDCHFLGRGEETAAFLITLDAINFGSGYFPEIFGPRVSGYLAVARSLKRHFDAEGPLSARRLGKLTAADCVNIFRFDQGNEAAKELARHFASALNQLGDFLAARFNESFMELLAAAENSAPKLVGLLAQTPGYDDAAQYRGRLVCFFKRAQITAADLHIAFAGQGPGLFRDIDRLTILADNLVPHVLRRDGILNYSDDLAQRIDRGEPIAAGSEEEVELRACAVHAGELILEELHRGGRRFNAMQLDNFLWHRGQLPSYRTSLRHLTRSHFY